MSRSSRHELDALLERLTGAESQCAALRENHNSFSNRLDDVNADLQAVRAEVRQMQKAAKQATVGVSTPQPASRVQPPPQQQQPVDLGYSSYDASPPKNRQGPSVGDAFNPSFARNAAAPASGVRGAPPSQPPPQPFRAGFDEGPGIRNTEAFVPRAPNGARR